MILAAIEISGVLNLLEFHCDQVLVDLLGHLRYLFLAHLNPLFSIPDRLILTPHLILSLFNDFFQFSDLLPATLVLSTRDWLSADLLGELIIALFEFLVLLSLLSDLLLQLSHPRLPVLLLLKFLL